jgi:uncharacterized protein (DUF427 family)
MATRERDVRIRALEELRYEPTEKRVRATLGDRTVVDSTRAALVWEPRRVVPSYAVPVADLHAELVPHTRGGAPPPAPAVLHPGIPFGLHSCAGEAFSVRAGDDTREDVAFRPADPDLADYAVLDFRGFDAWYDEEEPVVSHPRDPFHRVDILRSSRQVRVELDGTVLAESGAPHLVFETDLPLRFYLPREAMRVELEPSAKRTYCPYKGQASYWSFDADSERHEHLAWTYEQPLHDAAPLAGLVAFFDERVDVILDGERRERPRSLFARAILDEAGV